MQLDASQERFCNSSADRIRLLAPAGSGKTLSLLYRCKRIAEQNLEKPQRFLIFTFTRAARDELQNRLNSDASFSLLNSQVRVETLNRWGLTYLRNQQTGLAVKSSKSDYYFLINNALRPTWSKVAYLNKVLSKKKTRYSDLVDVISTLKTCGFRHDAGDLIGEFQNHWSWITSTGLLRFVHANVIEPLRSMGLTKSHGDVDTIPEQFLRFWARASASLWEQAILTLDDQKYWALLKLQENYKETFFPEPSRYHHVFVDEFQDVNPLDISLIRELVRVNKSSLTIVGDDDQAIYEWRGATPAFILDPDVHLGGKFETHTLEFNYRSPANIVRLSQQLINWNASRVEKRIVATRSDDATIVVKTLDSHDVAVDTVLRLAREACTAGRPKALAVLARKKSQLLPLQVMLTSEEIPFYAKEDLNVLLSDAFNELKVILEAIATKDARQMTSDIVSRFVSCCEKVHAYPLSRTESKQLYAYLMQRRPRTFMSCLDEFQSYTGPLRSRNGPDVVLEFALPVARVMEASTVASAMNLVEEHMTGLRRHYSKGEDDVFYKDPPFTYLGEYAERYEDRFLDFVDHVDEAIAMMASHANTEDVVDPDLDMSVHLMTALRAKGKEFETVVLLDANEGIWPIKHAETKAELEQERRLFYVGVTRTQSTLIILPVRQLAGQTVTMTRYIDEMGVSPSAEHE